MRLTAGLVTLLLVICFATDVSAHAALVAADPGDGSILAVAAKTVRLRFNEAVSPALIKLIDAEGRARDDATVRAAGESIFVALPENLPQGTQIISYRVTSEDGHPVAGSLVFSIGAATAAAAVPANTGAVNGLIWLARIGVYLGLFGGVGGAFFAS